MTPLRMSMCGKEGCPSHPSKMPRFPMAAEATEEEEEGPLFTRRGLLGSWRGMEGRGSAEGRRKKSSLGALRTRRKRAAVEGELWGRLRAAIGERRCSTARAGRSGEVRGIRVCSCMRARTHTHTHTHTRTHVHAASLKLQHLTPCSYSSHPTLLDALSHPTSPHSMLSLIAHLLSACSHSPHALVQMGGPCGIRGR